MVKTAPYILFVDDDADDRELLQLCCEELFIAAKVQFVTGGEALFDFLRTLAEPERYPSLLVLDVNMPGVDGEEALLRLKRDPRYRSIPVVMLSTASQRPDYFTYIGADAFYTKPNQYLSLKRLVAALYERLTSPRF
ncbi:MAG TPA: response regulator [Flavisolibacter sp.]